MVPERSGAPDYVAWLRTARVGPIAPTADDETLRNVRYVHGAPPHGTPSPLAVLGHRVGADAMRRLGANREDGWHLVVVFRAPEGHAALAALDGLLAATGASPGKGNLRFEARAGQVFEVEITHRPTGRVLTYRLTEGVVTLLGAVPTADFARGIAEIERLKDTEVFAVSESRRTDR